jgi:hypothetical protein
LRDLLIGLLGLNVLGPKSETERAADVEKGFDPTFPKFVPFAFLAGQPEVIKHYLEQAKRRHGEEAAATDEAFEAFSQALLTQIKTGRSGLPGKMASLLTDDLRDVERNAYWKSEEVQLALQSMGVKPRAESKAVPHIGARPAFMEKNQGSFIKDEDLEQMGERPHRKRVDVPNEDEIEKFKRALKGED